MNSPGITLESVIKINIWYQAALYLGIALIVISASNPTTPAKYSNLGTLSLALGAVFVTAWYLIGVYDGWVVEDLQKFGGRWTSWETEQRLNRVAPVVWTYEFFSVIGLIIWVLALLG